MPDKLHERMRTRRIALGITQAEVARRAGVQQNRVSLAERGGDVMTSTLLRLIRALDMELIPIAIEDAERVEALLGADASSQPAAQPASLLDRYRVSEDDEEPTGV